MAQYPILVFPAPARVDKRHKLTSRPPDISFPGFGRQKERLQPLFRELSTAFRKRTLEVRRAADGAFSEQVLVLETIGSVTDFNRAVGKIKGLEWLAEWDEAEIEPDADFHHAEDAARDLSGRLYLVMSNQRGLRELIKLWHIWLRRNNDASVKFPRNLTRFRDVFSQLKDVRLWGPQDRIRDTGLIEFWNSIRSENPRKIRLEVELWCRDGDAARERSATSAMKAIKAVGGTTIRVVSVPEISYQAIVADVPPSAISSITELGENKLVRCDEVMFFRPAGQTAEKMPQIRTEDLAAAAFPAPKQNDPVIALFDGLPQSNHPLLAKHLIVDDPDGWAASYASLDMKHGTAMASLIVHGDLSGGPNPIDRKIYVRPVMKPVPGMHGPGSGRECIPNETTPVDIINRAVRRLFESDGVEPAAAPTVKVINLSICEYYRPFVAYPSPWARLLDFLAWKYKVLFIISAGNQTQDIALTSLRAEWTTVAGDAPRLKNEVLRGIEDQRIFRRIMSPAESLNNITVGSSHSDSSVHTPSAGIVNPYAHPGMPSPINSQGPGFRNAVKPEILLPGGRQLYWEKLATGLPNNTIELRDYTVAPGIKVAGPSTGLSSGTYHIRGTSVSAALASRSASRIHELLDEIQKEQGTVFPPSTSTLLIKTLLVHGADWGNVEPELASGLRSSQKRVIASMLGFGNADHEKVMLCSAYRATVIGTGSLVADAGQLFKLPLPPCLSGQSVLRRLIVTLAWFTPTNSQHNQYRQAALWFAPEEGKVKGQFETLLQIDRSQVDGFAVRKGTIQHEIFEGSSATAFADGNHIGVQVNCRAEGGGLKEAIPYSLAITLETPTAQTLPIYNEIRARIPIEVRPRVIVTPPNAR